MQHALPLLLALLCAQPYATAAAVPVAGAMLVPQGTTFKSWADYRHFLQMDPATYHGGDIESADLEIRRTDPQERIVRLPYLAPLDVHSAGTPHDWRNRNAYEPRDNGEFTDEEVRNIGDTPAGEYLLALNINNARASNVIAVRIDPAFDIAKAPVLELGIVEPSPPGAEAKVVLWETGPTPENGNFTTDDFCNLFDQSATLMVDGVDHPLIPIEVQLRMGVEPWPLRSGARMWQFLEPAQWKGVDPAQPHTYALTLGPYKTAPLTVNATTENALNTAWDEATPTVKDRPAPVPLIRGRLMQEDGKPADHTRVYLGANGTDLYSAATDDNGEYVFPNIPPGHYAVRLYANSLRTIQEVTAAPGTTQVVNFQYRNIQWGVYSLAGRVMNAQQQPVAGIVVEGEWTDPATGDTDVSTAVTKADGTYRIRGAFKVATRLKITTRGVSAPPLANITAGTTDADFVVQPVPNPYPFGRRQIIHGNNPSLSSLPLADRRELERALLQARTDPKIIALMRQAELADEAWDKATGGKAIQKAQMDYNHAWSALETQLPDTMIRESPSLAPLVGSIPNLVNHLGSDLARQARYDQAPHGAERRQFMDAFLEALQDPAVKAAMHETALAEAEEDQALRSAMTQADPTLASVLQARPNLRAYLLPQKLNHAWEWYDFPPPEPTPAQAQALVEAHAAALKDPVVQVARQKVAQKQTAEGAIVKALMARNHPEMGPLLASYPLVVYAFPVEMDAEDAPLDAPMIIFGESLQLDEDQSAWYYYAYEKALRDPAFVEAVRKYREGMDATNALIAATISKIDPIAGSEVAVEAGLTLYISTSRASQVEADPEFKAALTAAMKDPAVVAAINSDRQRELATYQAYDAAMLKLEPKVQAVFDEYPGRTIKPWDDIYYFPKIPPRGGG